MTPYTNKNALQAQYLNRAESTRGGARGDAGLDAAMQAVNAKKPALAGFAYIDCEHGENIAELEHFRQRIN
jgi:hypothetical protein